MRLFHGIVFLFFTSLLPGQDAWNIELLGSYERGDEKYSGSWGFLDSAGTEYALLGTKNGMAVYTMEAPLEEVGFVPGPVSNWREITVVGHHAYVVTEGGGAGEGMQVVDLSYLPDSVHLVTTYTATFTRAHIIQKDIFDEAPYVYVCGTSTTQGVHILDVSDPANPMEVGVYLPGYYIHDCHVRQDRLYALAFFNQTIDIVDISDPSVPMLEITLPDPGSNTHSCSTDADQHILFLTDELDGLPARIFDIQDLGNPTEIARYTANPQSLVHNPYILGDFVVITHNTEGLRIVDICDPALPVEVGYYDTYDGPSGGFHGLWSAYPYFPSGRIIGGDRTKGLLVWTFNQTRAARIYGSVVELPGELPLPEALVRLLPQNDTLEVSPQGTFQTGLLAGEYQVLVEAPGYPTQLLDISLAEGDKTTLEFSFGEAPLAVPALEEESWSVVVMERELHVRLPINWSEGQIEIWDFSGKKIKSLPVVGATEMNISLPEVAAGIYLVTIRNGTQAFLSKKISR